MFGEIWPRSHGKLFLDFLLVYTVAMSFCTRYDSYGIAISKARFEYTTISVENKSSIARTTHLRWPADTEAAAPPRNREAISPTSMHAASLVVVCQFGFALVAAGRLASCTSPHCLCSDSCRYSRDGECDDRGPGMCRHLLSAPGRSADKPALVHAL